MDRTKQLVLSAFKPIFSLKSAQHSKNDEEAVTASAAPPSYSELPLGIPDATSNWTPITDQARPIRLFPSSLPPRPRKEPTLAFHKRKTTSTPRHNFLQAPTWSSTQPVSPVTAESSEIFASGAARSWESTRDDDAAYFTPPTSPTSSMCIPGRQAAGLATQDATSSPPKFHDEASQLDSAGKGKQVLRPAQPMQPTFRSTSAPSSGEPNWSEIDQLSERFAKLKTGIDAPALSPGPNSSSPSPPSRTSLSHISSLQICPPPSSGPSRRRIDSLMPTPTETRRQSIPDTPGPTANCSSAHDSRQSPNCSKESRNEHLGHLRMVNSYRRPSHTTQQPPNTSPAGPSKNPTNKEHSQYPDLSSTLPHSSRDMSVPPRSNAALPDMSNPDGFAAAAQEMVDRSLAEALQQVEDDQYHEVLAWIIALEDDHPNALEWEHTTSNVAASASNRKTSGTGRWGDPIDLISESSSPGNKTRKDEADDGKEENEVLKTKRKKRKTATNAVRGMEDCVSSHRPAKARRVDCAVCGDSVRMADNPALSSCTHEPQTCLDCFASWIKSELDSKGWRNIKCPGSGCRVMLSHQEVQRYASKEVFEQYDTLTMRAALNNDPDFRWCRAAGCSSGQIHLTGEDGNIFRCNACGHRVCVVHDATFHEGETCQEFDYRISGKKEEDQRKQEEASERVVKKLSKKCPGKGCSYSIQKNEGCDHMTCTQCQHEFCFECLADYNKIRRKGNGAHKKNCKYHSSRIEAYDSE